MPSPPTPKQIHTLEVSDHPTGLDLTNDGRLLAVAIRKAKGQSLIRVLETSDGTVVGEYGGEARMGWGVGFLEADKSLVYLVREDETQHQGLYRVKVGAKNPERVADWPQNDFYVSGICRNRDGTLYSLHGEKTQVRRAKDNEVVREIDGFGESMRSCFDSKGDALWLSGVEKGQIVLVEITNGKVLRRVSGPGDSESAEHIAISPDGRYLAVLGEIGAGLAIHDLSGREAIRIVKDKDSLFEWDESWGGGGALAFSNDSSLAVYISTNIEAFDLPEWKLRKGERSKVAGGGAEMWWSTSAWDAPMMAFGGHGSKTVIWFPLG